MATRHYTGGSGGRAGSTTGNAGRSGGNAATRPTSNMNMERRSIGQRIGDTIMNQFRKPLGRNPGPKRIRP